MKSGTFEESEAGTPVPNSARTKLNKYLVTEMTQKSAEPVVAMHAEAPYQYKMTTEPDDELA